MNTSKKERLLIRSPSYFTAIDKAKADTRMNIRDAKSRMEYINRVDSEIGLDPDLILAKILC